MILNRARETKAWLGIYERETQHLLRGCRGMAWDVGAAYGFFTVLLALSCRVVAVEPDARNAELVRSNLLLNGLEAEVVEAAVADRDGTGRFVTSFDLKMHHLAVEGDRVIPTVTLDTLLARYGRPDLVKLDVEGAEVRALDGATRLLESRPRMVIEAHSEELFRGVVERLEAAQYTVECIGWRVIAS